MVTHNRTLVQCPPVRFRCLTSSGSRMYLRDDYCFSKIYFILALCAFWIGHIRTDIRALGWCNFCSCCLWCSAASLMTQQVYPWSCMLHSFLSAMYLGSVRYSLTFTYCERAFCFDGLLCCRTRTWVQLDARCWSTSRKSSIRTTMRLLWMIRYLAFSSFTVFSRMIRNVTVWKHFSNSYFTHLGFPVLRRRWVSIMKYWRNPKSRFINYRTY